VGLGAHGIILAGSDSEGRVASDIATSWRPDDHGSKGPATESIKRGTLDGRGSEGPAAGDVGTSWRFDRRGVEGPASAISAKSNVKH